MGEAVEKPDAFSYLQSLEEALNSINPRSIKKRESLESCQRTSSKYQKRSSQPKQTGRNAPRASQHPRRK
jgi:hypothetical protein